MTNQTQKQRSAVLKCCVVLSAIQASAFSPHSMISIKGTPRSNARMHRIEVEGFNHDGNPSSGGGHSHNSHVNNHSRGGKNSLNYRNGDDEDSEARKSRHDEAATSVMTSSESYDLDRSPEEQCDLDNYLKFLDRRYNRLHRGESDDEGKGKFIAWNWVFKSSDNSARVHEDALYVLGVAKLASQRLLQQHHLQAVDTTGAVIDSEFVVESPKATESVAESEVAKLIKPLYVTLSMLTALRERRDKFLISQSHAVRCMVQNQAVVISDKTFHLIKRMMMQAFTRARVTAALLFMVASVLVIKPIQDSVKGSLFNPRLG